MSNVQTGRQTVREVALSAATAERTGDFAAAALAWRRLVQNEPENGAWRLRLSGALARAGEPNESVEAIALQQLDAALTSGRPLVALLAALSVDGANPAQLLKEFLAGAARLGKSSRVSPPIPRPDDAVAAPFDADASLPDAPERPAVGPLPPMPLLSLLDVTALESLLPHIQRRALNAGDVLMAEGESADALYLVAHGVLEVTKEVEDRPTLTLGRVAEGAVLGEMALVLAKPRTATVTAVTEVETVRVDVSGLRAVADHVPAVQAALSEFTRQRVVQMLLATSPLFRDLDPPARAALLEVFSVRDLAAATVITRQGAEGKALRVVVNGGVDIWREDVEGEAPARIAHLGPGQVFGEIALLTGQPATATVITTCATSVLELTRDVMSSVTQRHPGIAERLARISEERLAEMRFIFQDDDFFEEAD